MKHSNSPVGATSVTSTIDSTSQERRRNDTAVPANLSGVGSTATRVTSPFWARYRSLVRSEVLPYQWEVMNDEMDLALPNDPAGNPQDTENSHVIRNLRIAAGEEPGHHAGFPFQDSDAYKWLEAVAYTLASHDAPDLHTIADSLVDLIARAQQPDGYLNTLFQIDMPERRFKRVQQSHELYTMGHYIEAGVAYHGSTGSQKALDIACRMADCIDAHFGQAEGKIHGADGHPEVELALARLYEVTSVRRYLDLAHFFLKIRGVDPDFYALQNQADGIDRNLIANMKGLPRSYYQADRPISEQTTAEGHAVRSTYLCTGMAEVARLTGDQELLAACRRLWDDIVNRRMFVTGNVGSTQTGESFTYDYDLPNDTMYGETCASVGMTFFAKAMLENHLDGRYADVIERELFNGALAGMSLDGKHFFYVNPLEADPAASKGNPGKAHVLTRRAEWFGCACCPSNVARLIAGVDRYLCTTTKDEEGMPVIAIHQFIANQTDFADHVRLTTDSDLPWGGHVTVSVGNPERKAFTLAVRIPGWSAGRYTLAVNGHPGAATLRDGFVYVPVTGDHMQVSLDLDMSVHTLRASNRVRADMGDIAIQRGPIVYCAEQCDNPSNLWLYATTTPTRAAYHYEPDLLGGMGVIDLDATVEDNDPADSPLYRDASSQPTRHPQSLRLIPYYAWANRAEGQMNVWLKAER